MTPKTWEEVEELVAAAIYTPPTGSNRPTPWTADRLAEQQAIAGARCAATVRAKAALRALRAAGLAVVDEEVLATIRDWCGEGTEDFADAESVHIKIGRRVTIFMTLGDLRALSAGELAPPDKGEG